jgi:Undecaprenyl-phosphate glucose phosphotransferase
MGFAAQAGDRRAKPARQGICPGMAHVHAKIDSRPRRGAARAAPARVGSARSRRHGRWRHFEDFASIGFAYLAALLDGLAIFGAAASSSALYGIVTLGRMPFVESPTAVGAIVAAIVVAAGVQNGEYVLERYGARAGRFSRSFSTWNFAFLCALALGFATRTSGDFSRGAVGVFYVAGFLAMFSTRLVLIKAVERTRRAGLIRPRRVVVVGFEDALVELAPRFVPSADRMEIAAMIALRDNQAYLADDLALAAAAVRMLRPDDIYVAIPWSRIEVIEASVDVFLRTPAEIHLGAEAILERFKEARVVQFGPTAGLGLTRPPLTRLQRAEKRLFDLLAATLGLIALAPLFAVVALCIRWEGPGPILFRQTRYGFNQEPFRIIKFRTMTTMEDGAAVKAATRADPRVTRVGAVLRRFSIDELPQLLNVLAGEMSIVGPRPHALAHDQRYVARISRYARRHNVKPGITGWAQVCGHRGEIRDDEDMQARIDDDLYYVDNWSLWLDVKIVLWTFLSVSAHRNAY